MFSHLVPSISYTYSQHAAHQAKVRGRKVQMALSLPRYHTAVERRQTTEGKPQETVGAHTTQRVPPSPRTAVSPTALLYRQLPVSTPTLQGLSSGSFPRPGLPGSRAIVPPTSADKAAHPMCYAPRIAHGMQGTGRGGILLARNSRGKLGITSSAHKDSQK